MSGRSRVFNTYLTGDNQEHIKQKLLQFEDHVDWYIGQDEVSTHGMEHIQLLFGFKNPRTLSKLQSSLPCGGNIQITKDTKAMLKYCTDESKRSGELYTFGDVPEFHRKKSEETKNLIMEAKAASSYREAMALIEQQDIVYYISNEKKLAAYFTRQFAEADTAKYPMESFNIKQIPIPEGKTLIFVGETNIGKTQFACAHFKTPLLIRGKQDWARYNDTVTDGIVIDDVCMRKWNSTTVLHTVERETAVTMDVKYSSVRIPAGIPKIICLNDIEQFWPDDCPDYHRAAISRRIVIHTFHGRLFNLKR